MDVFQVLFGFSGRINRTKYWLAVGVAFFMGMLVVSFALWGIGDIFRGYGSQPIEFNAALRTLFFVIAVIVYSPLLISFTAISIKRLHDRNKSGWWLLVLYVLPAVLSHIAEAAGTDLLQFIFSTGSLALSIWGFVEIGCLRGTAGPNKYGSDPLAS